MVSKPKKIRKHNFSTTLPPRPPPRNPRRVLHLAVHVHGPAPRHRIRVRRHSDCQLRSLRGTGEWTLAHHHRNPGRSAGQYFLHSDGRDRVRNAGVANPAAGHCGALVLHAADVVRECEVFTTLCIDINRENNFFPGLNCPNRRAGCSSTGACPNCAVSLTKQRDGTESNCQGITRRRCRNPRRR